MALKQMEDLYEQRRREQNSVPIRQELSDKLQGYAEGVIHGWEAAARAVSEATNGLFTLPEPQEITEWRARLKRAKGARG